jgi:hypothetical protein
MHAKHTYLYSYESPEPTLPERKKNIQIELLDVMILTIKVKS